MGGSCSCLRLRPGRAVPVPVPDFFPPSPAQRGLCDARSRALGPERGLEPAFRFHLPGEAREDSLLAVNPVEVGFASRDLELEIAPIHVEVVPDPAGLAPEVIRGPGQGEPESLVDPAMTGFVRQASSMTRCSWPRIPAAG